jgi:short-subunit dehydrogenase
VRGSDPSDRKRIDAHVRERRPLHVLVHNAGSNVRNKLVDYDDAAIERLIALNLGIPDRTPCLLALTM